MPSKSRRGKGKRSTQKRRERQSRPVTTEQPLQAAPVGQPLSRPTTPAPPRSASTSTVKVTTAQYSYVTTELRTIGILTGVMLVILIVLSLVLNRGS